MTETADALVVEFPKTVTACHKEIKRLEAALDAAEERNSSLTERLFTAKERLSEIMANDAAVEAGGYAAIHAFLDECERTGPLLFEVPQTERAQRAIVALHDVVGRNP